MIDDNLRILLLQEMERRNLPDNFLQTIENSYMQVASQIANAQRSKKGTLLVSFNGAQGSGKSTITAFLKLILFEHFDLFTAEVSIDDFYLKRDQRKELSESVHPLFITRGVPGTHDVKLAVETIDCLKHCSENNPCKIPAFDKAIDDRLPVSDWPVIQQKVSIILFEGWCNHAPVQAAELLSDPINHLEREEDQQVIWREYANRQLENYHRLLFSQADMLIYLQVPSFEKVYEWRGLQEKKLAFQKQQSPDLNLRVMDDQQLARFIQHYERITRSCLTALPGSADIVLELNAEHGIDAVKYKN